jgi:hypothetical protein
MNATPKDLRMMHGTEPELALEQQKAADGGRCI